MYSACSSALIPSQSAMPEEKIGGERKASLKRVCFIFSDFSHMTTPSFLNQDDREVPSAYKEQGETPRRLRK